MKKVFPLLVIFAIICVCCKSTKATNSLPEPAFVESPNFTSSGSRVDDARKRAIDFESPAYFPSEWDAIEVRYATAATLPLSTQGDIADAYDDIFRKTIQLYAQAREDEIIFARDELISTGFIDFLPGYLKNSDKTALAALKQYEEQDYYNARDTAAIALDEYETLLIGAKVFLARNKIENRSPVIGNSDNLKKGDELARKARNEYETGNNKAAVVYAEEALLYYDILLAN